MSADLSMVGGPFPFKKVGKKQEGGGLVLFWSRKVQQLDLAGFRMWPCSRLCWKQKRRRRRKCSRNPLCCARVCVVVSCQGAEEEPQPLERLYLPPCVPEFSAALTREVKVEMDLSWPFLFWSFWFRRLTRCSSKMEHNFLFVRFCSGGRCVP